MVGGDFNRHNSLWGGSHTRILARQDESAPIVDLIAELSLECLLPVGQATFESDRGRTSTIDLILATLGLAGDLAKCGLWEHEYGSDHRSIHTSFWVNTDEQESQARLMLKNAQWDKVREAVVRQKGEGFPIDDVDQMVSCLNT